MPIPKVSSGISLATLAQGEPSSSSQQQQQAGFSQAGFSRPGTPPLPIPDDGAGGPLSRAGSGSMMGGMLGKGPGGQSGGDNGLLPANPICASLPRSEMTIIPPIMQHK